MNSIWNCHSRALILHDCMYRGAGRFNLKKASGLRVKSDSTRGKIGLYLLQAELGRTAELMQEGESLHMGSVDAARPRSSAPRPEPETGPLESATQSNNEASARVESFCQHARTEDFSEEPLRSVLLEVFKHDKWRGPQLDIIQRVLRGSSALAILPTGRACWACFLQNSRM